MKIGKKEFDLENHCYVMGILNVTPDSFSDGGKWNRIDPGRRCHHRYRRRVHETGLSENLR